ncbi:hypothetical protein D1872_261800 [compost metagenome]
MFALHRGVLGAEAGSLHFLQIGGVDGMLLSIVELNDRCYVIGISYQLTSDVQSIPFIIEGLQLGGLI